MNQQTAEEFVRLWQTSTSATEVGKQLGISRGSAYGRALRLRKKGVPLKQMTDFKRGRSDMPTDYGALKRLAESLTENALT